MKKIVFAKPLKNFHIKVRFSDGVEGIVDLSNMVGKGVFKSWLNHDEFTKVSINPDTHTVTWPDGIDLCPDSLYKEITKTSGLKSDKKIKTRTR